MWKPMPMTSMGFDEGGSGSRGNMEKGTSATTLV